MNRKRLRIALGTLPLLALGGSLGAGCMGEAAHTYFDDLIDGSADGTTGHDEPSAELDASIGTDGSIGPITGDDGGGDAALADDAGNAGDAGTDAAMDGEALDGAAEADAKPVEAGCGPTSTVANCGACGVACDTTHSAPSACVAGACMYSGCDAGWGDCAKAAPNTNGCETPLSTPDNCTGCGVTCDSTHSVGAGCTGTTCTYAGCKAGWSMCSTAAPNTAGCACNTPGCCDGGCEDTHTNGIINTPTNFYDCVAPKTYNSEQAFKACAAFTDAQAACSGGWKCFGVPQAVICDNACTTCWVYGGTTAGQVTDCSCPGTQSGNWN